MNRKMTLLHKPKMIVVFIAELQWLEPLWLINLGWLELSSCSLQVILYIILFSWSQACSGHCISTKNNYLNLIKKVLIQFGIYKSMRNRAA